MTPVPRKPELLAPAGTIDVGLTAIDAGADAIYAGLPRFNARERGQNCTLEDLSKLRAYTRRHNRKLYVTLNTLIKSSELADVAELLTALLAIRPDAVIVQDLGVAHLIRTTFPELTLHASTQMGIHNSAGVRMAAALGFSRVILERQVTYTEIDAIRRNTNIELEVFIHGALCCGRSGACLFSSWMGGWSGNRGRCKQPCRRRYFSDNGNGFFFSPKDLYTLADLPRLSNMGLTSLKIEGRLRRSDAIGRTVEAYRLMLDTPPEEQPRQLPNAKRILANALGRKWTPPFRTTSDFHGVIQHRTMGTSGRLIGTVSQADTHGFQATLTATLRQGDTIRIQPLSGEEGPALTVTRLTVNQRPSRKVTAGSTCHIACDKPVPEKARIFKIGARTADLQNRIEKLPVADIALDLQITLTASRIHVALPALNLQWAQHLDTQPARKHALDAAAITSAFARTGAAAYAVGSLTVAVEPDLFLPASRLKTTRRQFWEWCMENVSCSAVHAAYSARLPQCLCPLTSDMQPTPPESTLLVSGTIPTAISHTHVARHLDQIDAHTDEAVLPEFCPEPQLDQVQHQITTALSLGIRRFRVTSLYAFELLPQRDDIAITASFPIPICNPAAFAALHPYGITRATAWVELDTPALHDLLDALGNAAEVLTYARLPLLTTRMTIPVEGEIRDARGGRFVVRKTNPLTRLLPDKAFAMDPPPNCNRFIDLTDAPPDKHPTSTFNLPRDWA